MYYDNLFAAATLLLGTARAVASPPQCGCGYQDPETKQIYTDAIIQYFNESDFVDADIFSLQEFSHKKEQGWK